MSLYTRTGDDGTTSTFSGKRIEKTSCNIEVIGKIDELQSALDMLIIHSNKNKWVKTVQNDLWQLAGEISYEDPNHPKLGQKITSKRVAFLEDKTDLMDKKLTGFVRFRNKASCWANEARVRTRSLERELNRYKQENKIRPIILQYINRLSDFLFAIAISHSEEN